MYCDEKQETILENFKIFNGQIKLTLSQHFKYLNRDVV